MAEAVLGWTVVLAVGAACLGGAVAWGHPWRVRGLAARDASQLAAMLEALPEAERLEAIRHLAGVPSWPLDLAADLAMAHTDSERLVAANDTLGTLDHVLTGGDGWPRAGIWLTSAATVLVMVGLFLIGGGLEVLAAVPIGLVGIAACLWARRAGRSAVARQRQQADLIVRALVGNLYDREIALPASRRRRRRRSTRARRGP